jgi:hypothetical protein
LPVSEVAKAGVPQNKPAAAISAASRIEKNLFDDILTNLTRTTQTRATNRQWLSHTFENSLKICEGGCVSARPVNFGPPAPEVRADFNWKILQPIARCADST